MGYLVIDRQNMTLVHKCTTHAIASAIATIECARVPVSILPHDRAVLLARFSDYELKRLYLGITGADMGAIYFTDAIIAAVDQVIDAVPVSEFNSILVAAQADYAKANSENDDEDLIDYRYKPASTTPEALIQFKWPDPKQANPLAWETLAGLPKTNTLRVQPPAPAEPVAAPAPNHTPAQREPSGPRGGAGSRGAASTVFGVADEMWEKAGKPMTIEGMLQLRKEIMTHMEAEYGVKRTTSSSALCNWQKMKLEQSDVK
jgi:hypothetical protein